MAVHIKQGLKLIAHNKNAKYRMRFTLAQNATAKNNIQKTTYTYSKKIVLKKRSLSYQ